MDQRLGQPRGEAPDLFSSNLKKKRLEKKGELNEAGGEGGARYSGTVGNIFEAAIWVGWDPSNCLSIFNKSPSPTRRIRLWGEKDML